MRARFVEAELKRRRAEALADGLAHRVAQLESELRAKGGTDARRSDPRVAELEARLAESESSLVAAQTKLVLTEAALATSESNLKKLQDAEAGRSESERRHAALAQDLERRLAAAEQQLSTALRDAEERGRRAAEAEARTAVLEKRLATVQDIVAELEQALQRERAKVAEIESSQRRAQAAAVTSARDVIARLARHESKLSSLRREALRRAVALLEEAGAVHVGGGGIESRPTPPVPARSEAESPSARRTTLRLPTGIAADGAPTPIRGTHCSGSGPRRTEQGIAPGPRPDEPTVPPPSRPAPEDPEIQISVDEP